MIKVRHPEQQQQQSFLRLLPHYMLAVARAQKCNHSTVLPTLPTVAYIEVERSYTILSGKKKEIRKTFRLMR